MAKKKDGSAAGGAGRDEGRGRAPALLGAGEGPAGLLGPGEDTMGRDATGGLVPPEQDIDLFTEVTTSYDLEEIEEELESPQWAGEDLLDAYPTQFGRVMSSVDPNWEQLEGEPFEAVLAEAAHKVLWDVYGRIS